MNYSLTFPVGKNIQLSSSHFTTLNSHLVPGKSSTRMTKMLTLIPWIDQVKTS